VQHYYSYHSEELQNNTSELRVPHGDTTGDELGELRHFNIDAIYLGPTMNCIANGRERVALLYRR
jgi:hypothetical protein